jgi:hypothetical protein
MPSYLLSYRTPADYVEGDAGTMDAWRTFFEGIGTGVEEIGNPVFSRETAGNVGPGTALAGYSMISANSLDEALSLVAGCPLLKVGGGVEVGEITPISAETATAGSSATAA